jgi:hypothetical protein
MNTGFRSEKDKGWQEQVRRAETHQGGLADYCRRTGISVNSLNYWRRKLNRGSIAQEREVIPAFLPVEVMSGAANDREIPLPDPKWVAEVMLHLLSQAERGRG